MELDKSMYVYVEVKNSKIKDLFIYFDATFSFFESKREWMK